MSVSSSSPSIATPRLAGHLLRQTAAFREPGRLELLHGGMDADEREDIRQGFQADPSSPEGKVRVLLATDAASEGIDLQISAIA